MLIGPTLFEKSLPPYYQKWYVGHLETVAIVNRGGYQQFKLYISVTIFSEVSFGKEMGWIYLNLKKICLKGVGHLKDALTNNISSTSAVTVLLKQKQNRNDQLVQEAERKRRAQNLIIHGVQEVDAENQKEKEENFITAFLRVIGVEMTPESIVHLGKAETKKSRPLKNQITE